MGRLAVAIGIACAMVGVASAGPKKRILIDTTPPGASVYIGNVEDGEICKTPCPIEVDSESTVIIDLAGHKPWIGPIALTRKDKAPYKKTITLVPSIGKIIVEGPRGAAVTVDDEPKGKAPVEIEIAAGTHPVVLMLDGKQVYAAPVEVIANDEIRISGSIPKGGGETKPPPDDIPLDPDPTPGVVKPAKPSAPRAGHYVSLSADIGVGFRDFTYNDPNKMTNPDLNEESEKGQILAGPAVEVWPGVLLGVRALRGLSVVGRAQFGVNAQVVKTDDDQDTAAKTFWRSFEVSLRQRWVFGDTVGVEVGAGYVRDQHSFSGDRGDIALVPDADYQSLRIGARVSLPLGKIEPFLAVENRIVLDAGNLQDRFMAGADVSGLRAALGASASFGNIAARIEGSLTRYSWKIANAQDTGTDGALDSIKLVSIVVGYAY
ncbi:MAG: PEGA domain-containing protein [Kofleriaceae bacterium]